MRMSISRGLASKVALFAFAICAVVLLRRPIPFLNPSYPPSSRTLRTPRIHEEVRDETIVNLGYARYKGVALAGSQVTQWLGIPYAAPPLGNLRWREPQDPLPSDPVNVKSASAFAPTCLGAIGPPLSDTTNEDCLYLNIFAPTRPVLKDESFQARPLLPVWFFIQGGGFAGNTDNDFNGTEVVIQSNHSIVFVQINYRVGAFGFLASGEMHRKGELDLNVGLLDQRKALHWVRDHIHLFGGDPDHVVIHGDSAGAASVAYHLTAYNGRNDRLFVGAIAESPFWPTHRYPEEMEFQFYNFVGSVGCTEKPEGIMACLRNKDTAALQQFNVKSVFPGATALPEWSFLPVVDGTFATDYLYRLFERGHMVSVPLIVGDATDEGTSFAPDAETPTELQSYIKDNFPKLTMVELDVLKDMYPRDSFGYFPRRRPYFAATAAAYGESTFVCPGMEMANSMSFHNIRTTTWQYRYNVEDPFWTDMGRGVPHVSEKPAIFGPSKAVSEGFESYMTFNAPIVNIVMNYWLSFVQTLNPNTLKSTSAPEWRCWQSQDGRSARLKIQLGATDMEFVPAEQLERCKKWKTWALKTQQ